ncbi:hypothetical protein C8R47DRAFT_1106912 [Mycena vitilis]|nr:hypothetical protein C8R47DRAFT_1106912 [Mycena vitilis]
MQLAFSLATFLSLASIVLSSDVPVQADNFQSSCKAEDRVLIETRNVSAAGHEFQVSTKACSPDAGVSRPLEKRETLDACITGGS